MKPERCEIKTILMPFNVKHEKRPQFLAELSDVHGTDNLACRIDEKVTVVGRVHEDGSVTDVHTLDGDRTAMEAPPQLVAASVDNLKTWWLEPAPRKDDVQITYSYVIDSSLPPGAPIQVSFDLPNKITMRGNPHR